MLAHLDQSAVVDTNERVISVALSVRDFEYHDEYDQPPLDPASPLREIFRAMVSLLGDTPEVSSVRSEMGAALYPDLEFPGSVAVEVVLCSTMEAMHFAWETHGEPVGIFAVTGGPYEEAFADKLRIIVPCDEAYLRKWIEEERAGSSAVDPYHTDRKSDERALDAFLVTLTHELEHALDFIRHGGGISPRDIDTLSDCGEIDFDVTDACTGGFIREDMKCVDLDEHNDLMEERVEAAGRRLFAKIKPRLDPDIYSECLAAYSPASFEDLDDEYSSPEMF